MPAATFGRKDNISSILFTVTLAYSALMQTFLHQADLYASLKLGLYGLVATLTFHLLMSKTFSVSNRVIGFIALVAIGSQILRGATSLILDEGLVGRDILLVPLVMVVIGFNLAWGEGRTRVAAMTYGAASAMAGWSVVSVFGGHLEYSGEYFFAQKNQIGAVLGAAITLLLYQLVQEVHSSRRVGLSALVCILLLVANIVPLVQLRNRSTLFGLMLLAGLVCLKILLSKYSSLAARCAILGLIAIVLVFREWLGGILSHAFFANYDTTDVNSVSANRTVVYIESLGFLRTNLLWGDLSSTSGISDPHNFLLYQLVRFGAILSIGYMAVYFFFGRQLITTWIATQVVDVGAWAYLFVVSFTTSLFEYAQPFGPGTTQIAAWFFLGCSLRREADRSCVARTVHE